MDKRKKPKFRSLRQIADEGKKIIANYNNISYLRRKLIKRHEKA